MEFIKPDNRNKLHSFDFREAELRKNKELLRRILVRRPSVVRDKRKGAKLPTWLPDDISTKYRRYIVDISSVYSEHIVDVSSIYRRYIVDMSSIYSRYIVDILSIYRRYIVDISSV